MTLRCLMASRNCLPASCGASHRRPMAVTRLVPATKLHCGLLSPWPFHLEGSPPPVSNGNRARREPERRGSPRRLLAVPIRVRPGNVPWFEETMSLDFSQRGMRFRSHREYAEGERLSIALDVGVCRAI